MDEGIGVRFFSMYHYLYKVHLSPWNTPQRTEKAKGRLSCGGLQMKEQFWVAILFTGTVDGRLLIEFLHLS